MTAILSDCRKYRYVLTRETGIDNLRTVVFIGINPSTADETEDDPTVRKWLGFASRWGFGKIVVVNLFAYRATDPRVLGGAVDPVGLRNEHYQMEAMNQAELIVPCWGRITKAPKHLRHRVEDMRIMLKYSPTRPVKCLGKTQCGQPKHPLMLAYSTPLEDL